MKKLIYKSRFITGIFLVLFLPVLVHAHYITLHLNRWDAVARLSLTWPHMLIMLGLLGIYYTVAILVERKIK